MELGVVVEWWRGGGRVESRVMVEVERIKAETKTVVGYLGFEIGLTFFFAFVCVPEYQEYCMGCASGPAYISAVELHEQWDHSHGHDRRTPGLALFGEA